MTDQTERVTRLAEGKATAEDQLREENTELRQTLLKATGALRSLEQQAIFDDRLIASITGFVEDHPYKPILMRPAPVWRRKADVHEMMALVSDGHFPERVDPATAMGLAYNADIFRRRMEYLRDKIVRYANLREAAYPIRKLTLAFLGDMLSGDIHEELEITNEMPVAEAMPTLTYMLYDFARALAGAFQAIEVIVLPGNHPRLSKKPQAKQKTTKNWEYAMGKFLQGLAGRKFPVVVPKDLVYRHQVFNRWIGLTHGDGVKAQSFAGIPWYAMKQRRDALQALLKSLGQPQIDMLCYGHWHELIYQQGTSCELVINGSIKGGDEWTLSTKYDAKEPIQALLTFHERHGLTDLSRINLGHVTDRATGASHAGTRT